MLQVVRNSHIRVIGNPRADNDSSFVSHDPETQDPLTHGHGLINLYNKSQYILIQS